MFYATLTWTEIPSLRADGPTWRTLSFPRTPGSSCLTRLPRLSPPPGCRSACCTAGRCPAPASGNWPREPGPGAAPPGDPCLCPASRDTPANTISNQYNVTFLIYIFVGGKISDARQICSSRWSQPGRALALGDNAAIYLIPHT